MYLRHLRIERMKLFRDFDLSFTNADGTPRMWTVLIGENGTGKTTLLQAIALASVGPLQVNRLAGDMVTDLRDRRAPDAEVTARAVFQLDRFFEAHRDELPAGLAGDAPIDDVVVRSRVTLKAGEDTLRAR